MATEGDLRHLTSEQIQEFLDRGLPRKEEALVQEHLSVCPRCQEEVEGWSLLFTELGSLPELDPGPSLSRQVLSQLPIRGSAVAGASGRIRALSIRPSQVGHIPPESLQDYLEGILSGRDASAARDHLAACTPCQEELGGWTRLFGSLGVLGRFAPSGGFAERVLARVRIPSPVPAPWVEAGRRAVGWSKGFLPQTRRGWAVAGGVASAPTISVVALLYLVFSHPLLTVGNFTTYFTWKASALLASLFSSLGSAVLESVALFRVYSFLGVLAKSPLLVGVGGLTFSLMSALALWVLYRNLVATPSVDSRHATAQV